jgi:hypothetical protein
MAMDHSNTVHLMQSEPATPIAELVHQCERMEEILLADANNAAGRGLLDGSGLKELRGVNSYRNLVFDVFALARMAPS